MTMDRNSECRPVGPRCAASILVAGAVLALASVAGCSSGQPGEPPSSTEPHNVTLTEAQQKHIHVLAIEVAHYRPTITTTGVVEFDRNRTTSVLAPFSGPVTAVLATLGEHVRRGQALARVDSPDFTTAVGTYRKALIVARTADAAARNDRAMYVHQAISERENADAQAAAVTANADRTAARQALVALHMSPGTIAAIRDGKPVAVSQGVIRAPSSGMVVEKLVAVGDTLVANTTPCFTIADTSKMWVMAKLFGDDITRVRTGDHADILLGDSSKPLTGKVTYVSAVVDADTRAVNARVSVDNPGGLLKKLMYVSVKIVSRVDLEGLLVPVSAVLRNGQNLPFVYVVAGKGGYARQRVTLGPRIGGRFVIPSGLHAGDKVVDDGSIFLHFIQTQ